MPSPRPDGGGTRKRLGCSSSSGDGGCGGGGDSGGGGGPINVPISVPVRGGRQMRWWRQWRWLRQRWRQVAAVLVQVAEAEMAQRLWWQWRRWRRWRARRRPCAQAGAAPCRLNKPVLKATLPTDHVDHLLHEAFWPHETCIGPMHMNRFVRAHAIPVRPHM